MRIIRNLKQIQPALPPLALTIGNFDGVHLGHLQILNQVKKIAKEKNLATAVLTFEPHPIAFLRKDKPQDFRIFSLAKKLKILRDEKIDFVIVLPFNQKFAQIEAQNFINRILVESLNIKHLAIGYDFTFGKNREGNFKTLEEASKKFHFDLSEIAPVKKEDETCSSTVVRKLISEGKMSEAGKILGKNFAVCGIVNEGRKLASQLGFPTMNLAAKPHIIKPKFGVYKTITNIQGQKFPSITNFGVKPTVDGKSAPIFETHIPGFSQKIYGKKIRVEFLDFIREEKKFGSIEELKAQIGQDVKAVK